MNKLLIANRGEVSIRIASAAVELGIETVSIYTEEDAKSLHRYRSNASVLLKGNGIQPYLDIQQIVDIATTHGCDAVHPGYGFLSENPSFAEAITNAGLVFVGPPAKALQLLGDKIRARALALDCGIDTLRGTDSSIGSVEALEFFESLPSGSRMILKAVAGGGGRGMKVISSLDDVIESFDRCTSEAELAFGDGRIYAEEFLPSSRHIEVQVLGDGTGAVSHFWDRDCSIQHRHQKIIEVAPVPNIDESLERRLLSDAVSLMESVAYESLGTIEFLLDSTGQRYTFIEVNPRLQVEHTITEMITGTDLVGAQLKIASGATLESLNLVQSKISNPKGYAIQSRINMESIKTGGKSRPTGGIIDKFSLPSGQGIRCDTYGYAGYETSPVFDSLLAKIIVHSVSGDYSDAVRKAYRSSCEAEIGGFTTTLPLVRNLLASDEFLGYEIHTQFLDQNLDSLLAELDHPSYSVISLSNRDGRKIGTDISSDDPLAILSIGTPRTKSNMEDSVQAYSMSEGSEVITAPMQGTVVSVDVEVGGEAYTGMQVLVIEAMKMEHVITAPIDGLVRELLVSSGDTIFEGEALIALEGTEVTLKGEQLDDQVDLEFIRPDLEEVYKRISAGLDENRPEAVAKRRRTGHRTARENIAHLCDEGTFIEYGSMVVAGQRRRRTMDDLIKNTSGDGMVSGLGLVNGSLFAENIAKTLVVSYDYMVLAGTQGIKNHEKKDRLFELAEKHRLPTVLFAEGGGGRPGDTDSSGVAGLDCWAFNYFARLSALVPMVGITTGRCFAGNAVLLACCDVIIATADANIGVGGPAMIEGGGLGIYAPEEVGPMDVQAYNGVVDILVSDEAEAVDVAKKYLAYFQGSLSEWEAPDQRRLRHVVPENRLRYYEMRDVINGIADIGSVLEIRAAWGPGIITSLIRVEGRAVGVIANNPGHLSGAIDAEGADKAARFMQLCDAFDIPMLSLCDCPGIMVGPESEKTAVVRHAARLFVTGANIKVPLMTIVIRKGYGLGAQAMAGGSFHAPIFTVSWPTGEFGGMGLEGAVKLGYKKELEKIEDLRQRQEAYEEMVEEMYQRGKAINMASYFEIDQVIDPEQSRRWIMSALRSLPEKSDRVGKKRPNIDTW